MIRTGAEYGDSIRDNRDIDQRRAREGFEGQESPLAAE